MVNAYAVQSGGCRFESLWGFGSFLKGAHYQVDYCGKKTSLAGLQCTLTSSCAITKPDHHYVFLNQHFSNKKVFKYIFLNICNGNTGALGEYRMLTPYRRHKWHPLLGEPTPPWRPCSRPSLPAPPRSRPCVPPTMAVSSPPPITTPGPTPWMVANEQNTCWQMW